MQQWFLSFASARLNNSSPNKDGAFPQTKSNCARSQIVPDLELMVVVKWTLVWRKWVTPPGSQAASTDFPELNIPMNAWIYIAVRLQSFSLSTGVNLDHLPKRRLGSSFHFQAQKSKFHLWVLQITKLLYVKSCIRSFLQTGTNLGNRAVSVHKSFSVRGWVLLMTVLWHFKRQYVSRKAYGFIISNLHMRHICVQTEKKPTNPNNHKSIFSFSQLHCYKLY